ncbi:MAG: 4-hydroxy-tetrahydrodipicolinate reductase [Deltaproteobacteria bacterium]|nr:4-hydroxy-tetrahydrodipicolinate reductase [Deltaproteobacteria bacterium]
MTRVILAGATGWAGAALARGLAATDDLELVGAVGRKDAGRALGAVLGEPRLQCTIVASAAEALAARCDVFVEYTRPEAAKANALAALAAGAHVVIGTSGLGDDDYAELDRAARPAGRAVLAVGNFAITVVLLQRFAEIAARYLPDVELVDYAKATKPDAPSGTVRELAHRLGAVRGARPIAPSVGVPETRGGVVAGVPVHAVRLPGFVIGVEAIFGLPDQRLHLRHESGASATPYVDGALLAIRKVHTLAPGVHRGLDRVMDW